MGDAHHMQPDVVQLACGGRSGSRTGERRRCGTLWLKIVQERTRCCGMSVSMYVNRANKYGGMFVRACVEKRGWQSSYRYVNGGRI